MQLKIQDLQSQLNDMIDNCDDYSKDYSKIYELSVKLDMLIVEYYNELLGRKNAN
ncbi:MAG TPA: Spo0E family sporulation regulatory protein-aspartic acid phosphatase [Acetivibrio sp.]|uniref:Spo0E family sporulation regulatory protein-aspartic acid phosphatase n=1 Tax=Acetivibrio sp. TaxID=1872092 RepID=UPI002B60A4E7|nr:Spo0E family sporulation regulatory protein-aspartic acid phosphatase [Acetivibrio sp.]HOM01208.1 Spo0E family sporulation regulatory protein-aspartic acid phosphatase [Acetivibrio sp.]